MSDKQQKILASALNRYTRMQMAEAFDAGKLDSRPTESQQEVIDDIDSVTFRYALGGNQSGKSQLGAWEVARLFQENHPSWNRPPAWGDEPLLLLVIGRTTAIIEDTLWRKIETFLQPGTYKVQRQGGAIQRIVHKDNGNVIRFHSHHADNEAREKVQAYEAHHVWLDEMPGSFKLIEELHRRIQSKEGYFLATFTPKVVNSEIRRLVDASDGETSKKYKLRMFDNPIYTQERRDKILSSLITASESYKKTVLEGDWAVGEEQVYYFDYDTMVQEPVGYSPTWRHVEAVDPALSSKLGLTVWAEDPETGLWYCVAAEYVSGIQDPVKMLEAVQNLVKRFNIVRRVCDPHETWYLGTAATAAVRPAYMTPYNKNSRKGELIKNLQHSLGGKLRIAPWCEDLISEFQECRWSDRAENKIVNSSSYHLLDTAQYFCDMVPKPDPNAVARTWDDWLYRENEKRRVSEEKTRKARENEQGGGKGKRVRMRRKKWRVS